MGESWHVVSLFSMSKAPCMKSAGAQCSPLDMPLSINELALLPRMPVLLLRCPSLLAFRISLFRLITGVSAKGSMILVGPSRFLGTWSSSAFGVCIGTSAFFRGDCCSVAGAVCFFFTFSTGSLAGALFFVLLGAGFAGSALSSIWSMCSLSADKRADRLLLFTAGCSGSGATFDFFRRAGGGFAGSSGIGSDEGCARVIRLDVRRVNWKPSSSSSYAANLSVLRSASPQLLDAPRAYSFPPRTPLCPSPTVPNSPIFAAFLVAPFVRPVPFASVFALFTAGASSSSNAVLALLRRALARFVAIGSGCRGDLARTIVMGSVATGVVGGCGGRRASPNTRARFRSGNAARKYYVGS